MLGKEEDIELLQDDIEELDNFGHLDRRSQSEPDYNEKKDDTLDKDEELKDSETKDDDQEEMKGDSQDVEENSSGDQAKENDV